MHISFNSVRFFGILCRILFFSVPQRWSIELRSGDWLLHWRTLSFLLLNHSRGKFVVCSGSLSCQNFHLGFLNIRFALGMRLFSNIWRYMAPSIFPAMMWSAPLLCEVKQSKTIILYYLCYSQLVWYFYAHTLSPSSSRHDERYCDQKVQFWFHLTKWQFSNFHFHSLNVLLHNLNDLQRVFSLTWEFYEVWKDLIQLP